MSRSTLANAKAELFGLVASNTTTGVPVASLSAVGVVKCYDYEPRAGDLAKPIAVTVSTAGMTPDFWQFALRLYVSADVSVKDAQTQLDSAMVAIDGLMTAGFGPSQWTVEYVPEFQAMVASLALEVGRQDYY